MCIYIYIFTYIETSIDMSIYICVYMYILMCIIIAQMCDADPFHAHKHSMIPIASHRYLTM